jgi:solute:Na+ symporter, SSS family
VIGFYLPLFSSGRGATLGLLAAALLTSVWYVLGDPFGIDNMYSGGLTPMVVMAIEHVLSWPRRAAVVS